jgi:hypothetical protein
MVERSKWRKNGELQSRRRARRGGAQDFYRGRENFRENFEPVDYGNNGQIQSIGRDGGARRGAKLTRMRATGAGIKIGTKVELRRQEDDSEHHSTDTRPVRISEHPYTKTKLRPEWLRGQATDKGRGQLYASRPLARASKVLG